MHGAKVFSYKRVDAAFRPIIPIGIGNTDNSDFIRHEVLVDSGADWCVINADIGEAIGLNIENDKPMPFRGISGKEEIGYIHVVNINVKGYVYSAPVVFTRSLADDRYSIVGQVSFFDQFDVRLNYKERKIVLR